MEDINKALEEELSSQRILVFMEVEPLTNKYNQVYLNQEQFKRMTETLGDIVEKGHGNDGLDTVKLVTSEEEYVLPDLAQIND